jgi:hypothetical protein
MLHFNNILYKLSRGLCLDTCAVSTLADTWRRKNGKMIRNSQYVDLSSWRHGCLQSQDPIKEITYEDHKKI